MITGFINVLIASSLASPGLLLLLRAIEAFYNGGGLTLIGL